jgi:hypothetical protein
VKLLERVSTLLARHRIEHALIGAAALAAHGVARATLDLDLLAIDPACLEARIWEEVRSTGAQVEIRRGDDSDPLGGVVRITSADEQTVDLIVGKHAWQRDLLARSAPLRIGGAALPVVRAADLILLKLYAGGSFAGCLGRRPAPGRRPLGRSRDRRGPRRAAGGVRGAVAPNPF